jgi:hypothetical protein
MNPQLMVSSESSDLRKYTKFNDVIAEIPIPVFYLWVLHPVAHLSNWFLVIPSIATKFQYVTPPFLFSFTHYMFRALHTIRCF